MDKQIELLNKYVANLAVLNVKLHNLHWNVVGANFEPTHVFLEKLYTDLFEKYDQVAERIKMLGKFPEANMKAYLELTTVSELENKAFNVNEAMNITKEEYSSLITQAKELRKEADKNDDFITVALTEEHITIYDKELWFIDSALN